LIPEPIIMSTSLRKALLTAALLMTAQSAPAPAADAVRFQRDVRPILSEHCFRCHGFDEGARQAGLRLDTPAGATQPAESGATAVVPSEPSRSELIRRITSDDPAVRMPPPDSGRALMPHERETLRQWIEQGAEYTRHWSFEPPVVRPLPSVRQPDWPRRSFDAWVLNRLEQESLRPNPEADPARLLRRVSLDLTGLPPSLEELNHFQQVFGRDPEGAYEAEVERLLSSPRFGERMAIDWLDAARYADTNGYFGDKPRQIWPWRDWVIRAFNENMPFDRFTIEQLAGDLLPDPARDQLVATGFHRNSMANNETGIIDEEYRVEAVADRVETTATVWLGLTIGCAQCHDHKYDPVSQREYYQLFAFFNQSVESGLITRDSPPPTLDVPTPEQEAALKQSQAELKRAEQAFQEQSESLAKDLAAWEVTAQKSLPLLPWDTLLHSDFEPGMDSEPGVEGAANSAVPSRFKVSGTTLVRERGIRGEAGRFDATQHVELPAADLDADQPWTVSVWMKPSSSLAAIWSKIEPEGTRRGVEMIWQKGRVQIHLVHRWGVDEIAVATRDAVTGNDWHHLLVSYDGTRRAAGLRVMLNGRDAPLTVQRDTLTGTLQNVEPLRIGRRDAGLGWYGLLDEFQFFPRTIPEEEGLKWSITERLRGILERPARERTSAEQMVLSDHFIAQHASPELRTAHAGLVRARQREAAVRQGIPSTLIMRDRPEPRPTPLLIRGQYDRPGDEVAPGVPAALSLDSRANSSMRNRLDLARWLVARDNPLTARVIVNRLWQMCFGEGLVKTINDFGAQGDPPSHPDLLDELAVRFMDSGWDVKALLREIVTSATYRQSSHATEELLRRDPDNRLLARGPRFRLSAELIRDQALAVSGLLVPRIGGPGVKPYQPAGLWEEVSYNAEDSYVPDTGEGLWRRSLYTYWKRQVPPPAMLTFDAGPREKCALQRSRTSTPLQALVLLNDETYLEAARSLATLVLHEEGSAQERLSSIFRRVTSRAPEPAEQSVLMTLLMRQRAIQRHDAQSAGRLLKVGASPVDPSIEPGELAAWTLVAQTILNLDEVITRR